MEDISIHASREGSDHGVTGFRDNKCHISIHASREGSDRCTGSDWNHHRHFNPRFPRGKRPKGLKVIDTLLKISIHASREGSDKSIQMKIITQLRFQSTLPAREATSQWPSGQPASRHFNPRFPRGKRLMKTDDSAGATYISIHASREGSDAAGKDHDTRGVLISIHASREGSDHRTDTATTDTSHFNPRFPRGKRPATPSARSFSAHFNPRFPRGKRLITIISPFFTGDFNPRFPRGKRRSSCRGQWLQWLFQSTLPAREAT